MKSKKVILSLLSLFSLSLASCKEDSSVSKDTSKPEISTPSASTSVSLPNQNEETKYGVSFLKSDKVMVQATGLSESKALPGEEISFTVTSSEEEILSVTSTSALLAEKEGGYVFTRPNHEVTIEIKSEAFGDASILEVKDVDVTSLPNNVSTFKTYFEEARKVENTYFKSAHVLNSQYSGVNYFEDYEVNAGKNDVLIKKGHKKSNASDTSSIFFSEECGKQKDIYYSISSSSQTGSFSSKISKEYTFKTIVKDDSEDVGAQQIKEKDAKELYSAFGGAKTIYDRFFSESANNPLKDYPESPSKYNYYIKDIKKSLSADKKSVTFDLKVYYFSYIGTEIHSISFTFDGDKFLKEAKIVKTNYEEEECDEETGLPKENTVGTINASYELTRERGYKTTLKKTDISTFGRDDYDVDLSYQLLDKTVSTEKDNVIVENGSKLNFSFLPKDRKETLVTPHLASVKEGEGYLDLDSLVVLKEGTFTLVFDNGFGKKKEIKVTSIRPKAVSLSVSLPTKLFLNGTSKRKVTVLPEKASQEVTITKKKGEGEATFVKNEDGTYSVTGTKLGEATYTITSNENSEISQEVTFTVIEKPNAATFKANVLAKTFYGESSDYKAVVNFNEDGTGKYKVATISYWSSSYEEEASFTWTFDEEALTFTISGATGDYFTTSGFTSFTAIASDQAEGSFIHYNYSSSEPFTLTRSAQERKDLSEFN